MKLSLLFFFLCSELVSLSTAHGFVYRFIVDGTVYIGNVPVDTATSTSPSVIRQVSDEGPVKGATNPDINCGLSAQKAQLVASVNPGSQLQFDWREYNLNNWPHNTGPILTYMTSCGSVTCDQYDTTNTGWFKIAQLGKMDNGTWYQALIAAGQTTPVTIPSNLAPGNYIIRHEIIALQNAVSEGGAEFYPSCTQIKVGGSQTGAPQSSDLVMFPGAYSDTDPGILDPNVYDSSDPYNEKMPGPPIASFIQGSSTAPSGSGSGTTSSGTVSSSTSTAASSSPSTTSTPNCVLRRRTSSSPSNIQRRQVTHTRRKHTMWETIKLSISAF